jgi:hypothetical protein
MTKVTEYHVAITSDAPDFESIYAVFSTADKAEKFVIDNTPYDHAGRAVITPQSYVEDEDYDTAVDDRQYGIALDHRYDNVPDEN